MNKYLKSSAIRIAAATGLLPYGVDFAADLKRRFPAFTVKTIFDVGANIGQSIEVFSGRFPRAKICSFEPDPKTFATLSKRMSGRALLYRLGMSDRPGHVRFDDTSQVSEIHAIARDQSDESLPLVEISTIDEFCRRQESGQIDILKLDTEGHEISVIDGARETIRNKKIKTVFVECSLHQRESSKLVSFSAMQNKMRGLGYSCLGIYHQTPSWSEPQNPEIVVANCFFVADHMGPASPP